MSAAPKAFLFDLNGTMIDDMQYHLNVWYEVLNNDLNANLSLEQVRSHMYGRNDELLDRIFGKGRFSPQEVEVISRKKESGIRSYTNLTWTFCQDYSIFCKRHKTGKSKWRSDQLRSPSILTLCSTILTSGSIFLLS